MVFSSRSSQPFFAAFAVKSFSRNSVLVISSRVLQPLRSLIQRGILLAERKTHLPRSILRIAIETRPRHRRHSHFAYEVLRERHIIGKSELADVCHHVVRAPRTKASKACFLERRNQPVSPLPVSLRQIRVITRRHAQRHCSGLLQWRW